MKKLPSVPGGFSVIYADPPWQYSNKGTRSSAAKNYAIMSLDDLAFLPVNHRAAENAILFLWTTAPFMPAAIELGAKWGFTYKTIGFLWAKRNKKRNTAFFGMGNYTRANVEPCLLFVKGKPKVVDHGVAQFHWVPILRHSEKPPEIRDRIVRLMGDVPRLEMFARHKTPGWTTWGNELLPAL